MSHFTRAEDVYEAIEDEDDKSLVSLSPPREYERWINEQLANAASQYPFMKGKTSLDYIEWTMIRLQRTIDASQTQDTPTPEQFWDAAYDYGSSNMSSTEPSSLHKMLSSGKVEPLVLGELYGKYTVKLLPAMGALTVFDPDFESPLEFAATDSGAIFYPDGHPSEDQVFTLPKPLFPSPSLKKIPASLHPANDDKLRRFASLGWVIKEDDSGNDDNIQKEWIKTGFVLVIDMDDRKYRHRQPWFVLAPEWPTDGYEAADGTFTHRAPRTVFLDDASTYGVLAGGHNRTPLGQVLPLKNSGQNKPVIKQFGEGFNFEIKRTGGHRRGWPSNKGSDLAEVMDWYWDPVAEREVCFRKGLEYMRFNRTTRSYEFPNFSNIKIAGLNGFFGSLEEDSELEAGQVEAPESSSETPRPHRDLITTLGGPSMAGMYPPERRRLTQTAP